MKNKWITMAAGIMAMAVTATVQAVPITGGMSMGGSATLNNNDANTAVEVLSWGVPDAVTVGARSGSFASFVNSGDLVTMSPLWIFNPSQAHATLWTVDGFTFNLSSDSVFQGGGFLNVTGFGTITGNGFNPTLFTWRFQTGNPPVGGPTTFEFSAQTAAAVPDGGATVMLLGAALSALGLFRKKLIA